MHRSIKEMNLLGQGYKFDVLRAKALLRFGNVVPLSELVAFSLDPGEDEAEAMKAFQVLVCRGIDDEALVRAIEAWAL